MNALKTLVMMQLKDKLDLSFVKSTRGLIFKIVLSIVKLVVVTAVFYLLFTVCNVLGVFSPPGYIPDTVANILFTLIQLMSIVTCTAGITQTLYMTADNRVLLTLPASSSTIFFSKIILYYIFELKRNITFTLPMFISYGIVNGAVWYYYNWALFCFVFISMIPVAIGAIVSIPSLFVVTFVKQIKWLQYFLMIVTSGLIIWGIVSVIDTIPENIDVMGQWGSIFAAIQTFLNNFSKVFYPYYCLTCMIVGGTLRISSKLFMGDTFAYFGILIAFLAVLFGIAYLLAKPLFIKMASRQFEFEKMQVKAKPNKVRASKLSPLFESLQMNFRSGRYLLSTIIQLVLPAIAVLLLNKLYASMNTNYSGEVMTKAFNLLVMLVITVSFNNEYATVYSKEANARNIIKTRPQNSIYTLFGRIAPRIVVILISTLAVIVTTLFVSSSEKSEIVMMGIVTLLVSEAHLLWCAEMDVMRSYADQYATVGVQFDSPNERNATIIGFLLSGFFAFAYYFFSDRGTTSSIVKGLLIAAALLAVRIYLYVTRIKLYFVEK